MNSAAAWSWSDVQWSGHAPMAVPPQGTPHPPGGTKRPSGGQLSRFQGHSAHAERNSAELPPRHPAVLEGRTLFPSRVFPADEVARVLVGGHNSAKIGARVMKGPWRGFPIFTLTLEERATCPTSCGLWRGCYGNAMHMARRHQAGPALVECLEAELKAKAEEHPAGFAVRAHVLGDFYSSEYLWAWLGWMDAIPQLHVWGYTAHPVTSPIGRGVQEANDEWPERWAFRFSVEPGTEAESYQATTIWRRPEAAVVAEGQVCPMQMGRTQACATCALCWSPTAADKRIVFVGHGMRSRNRRNAP